MVLSGESVRVWFDKETMGDYDHLIDKEKTQMKVESKALPKCRAEF